MTWFSRTSTKSSVRAWTISPGCGFLNPGSLGSRPLRQTPLFSAADFIRYDDMVQELAHETDDSPFVRNLSGPTRKLLREDQAAPALKSALVEDFNRMLADPQFFLGFYRNLFFTEGLFSPQQRDFANWLLMTLGGQPDRRCSIGPMKDARALKEPPLLHRAVRRFPGAGRHGRL
jgi:hypothetical protein